MAAQSYFPVQRHLQSLTLIRRERMLPELSVGQVEVMEGGRVGFRDIIARGEPPSSYALLDAARKLGLRRRDSLPGFMRVDVDDVVGEGQLIAQRGRRRLFSPLVGRIAAIEDGRVTIQALADTLELESGMNGQIVSVRPGRGVVIETMGAVMQGVWGNGGRALGTVRVEPADGLKAIRSDAISMEFRGAIVVTRRPLNHELLEAIEDQEFAAVIAPSAEADLLVAMRMLRMAILLTEGFGSMRMSPVSSAFFDEMNGQQGMLDAVMPAAAEIRRPEIIITVPLVGARPTMPPINLSLGVGSSVRIARGIWMGAVGQVTELPPLPIQMENGLRVLCAQVELVIGERVTVPLANLEVSG